MQAIQDENKELASSTSQLNNLKTQLEEVEKKTENSTERLVRLGDQISDHKNKIDLLKKDIEEAGTQINLNQLSCHRCPEIGNRIYYCSVLPRMCW